MIKPNEATPPTLLYIHGFCSSGDSQKGRLLQKYVQQQITQPFTVLLPTLSDIPGKALSELHDLVLKHHVKALVGSSLGGFYATVLSEHLQLPCALINPVVKPATILAQFLGDNHNPYTNQAFTLSAVDMLALQAMELQQLSRPEAIGVWLQTADEILNYREALNYYEQAHLTLTLGGSHQYERFEKVLDDILAFLQDAMVSSNAQEPATQPLQKL